MPDKDNKEIVRRIIDTVEHPDNPEREAAIALHKVREQTPRQFKQLFTLIFHLLFIALFVTILINAWSRNSTLQNRWISIISGSVAGVVVCIVIEKRKPSAQKPMPPSITLVMGILTIIISLLVSRLKQAMSPLVIDTVTIFGVSFLLIVLGYALLLDLRTLINGNDKTFTTS